MCIDTQVTGMILGGVYNVHVAVLTPRTQFIPRLISDSIFKCLVSAFLMIQSGSVYGK